MSEKPFDVPPGYNAGVHDEYGEVVKSWECGTFRLERVRDVYIQYPETVARPHSLPRFYLSVKVVPSSTRPVWQRVNADSWTYGDLDVLKHLFAAALAAADET